MRSAKVVRNRHLASAASALHQTLRTGQPSLMAQALASSTHSFSRRVVNGSHTSSTEVFSAGRPIRVTK
jgi:hypothetical protein